jgi:hypothetical protein
LLSPFLSLSIFFPHRIKAKNEKIVNVFFTKDRAVLYHVIANTKRGLFQNRAADKGARALFARRRRNGGLFPAIASAMILPRILVATTPVGRRKPCAK